MCIYISYPVLIKINIITELNGVKSKAALANNSILPRIVRMLCALLEPLYAKQCAVTVLHNFPKPRGGVGQGCVIAQKTLSDSIFSGNSDNECCLDNNRQ